MFKKFIIECDSKSKSKSESKSKSIDYSFDSLTTDIKFEHVTVGRQGAILVDLSLNQIPVVRTTTQYLEPAQEFSQSIQDLIERFRSQVTPGLRFNNVLAEVYDTKYRTMSYHCDQAMDLDNESWIGIFSSYSNPLTKSLRKLVIKQKLIEDINNINLIEKKKTKSKSQNEDLDSIQITLDNHSLVLFSVATNKSYLHKIILDNIEGPDDHWLGLTFRLSKTFIKHIKNNVLIVPDRILRLADDTEKKEFYKCRGMENRLIDYMYPIMDVTISPSDLMPVTHRKECKKDEVLNLIK